MVVRGGGVGWGGGGAVVLWFHVGHCVSVCPSISRTSVCFSIPDFNLSKHQWISPKLVCALILWRSGLGLLMDKFRQFFSELSARDTIMAGYYSLTFLFYIHWQCITRPLSNKIHIYSFTVVG